ncbi:MAG: glycosyltransferase family 39 protein [Chloroflexota bacterium]|nr:glycosyltransferase family 39 protein [Dehalococcoidia bacterium]MDW8252413.1 glycosyltransferase family 39 protein [Chloroflexota bacterium]
MSARWAAAAVLLAAFGMRIVLLPELPPGLNMDEGFYGLDAMAALRGEILPFYPQNGGRESLFMLAAAPFVALLGRDPLALRLPAAFFGVLTVAVTIPLGRRLFRSVNGESAQWIGVAAAAFAATSIWLVIFNRIGLRINAFPFLLAAAAYWFWRAWETRRLGAWAAAGLAFGLTQYTYTAARIAPLIMPGYAAARLALDLSLSPLAARWRGLLLFVLVGTAVSAPLLGYALSHPEEFFRRQAKLNPFTEASGQPPHERYLTALVGTLPMFVVPGGGDARAYRNYPGAPVFDLAVAPFFLLGLGIALRRVRRGPYSFLILWFGVMLLATPLPLGVFPHNAHAFGMLPAVYLFPAIGLIEAGAFLARRGVPRRLVGAAAAALIVLSGMWEGRIYFVEWAALPEIPTQFDSDMVEMAAVMNAEAGPDTAFAIVQSRLYREGYDHGTIAFLYRGGSPYRFIRADEERIARQFAELVGSRRTVIVFERAVERDIAADHKRLAEFLLGRQGRQLWDERYDYFRATAWQVEPPLLPSLAPAGLERRDLPFGPLRLTGLAVGVGIETAWAIAEWTAVERTDLDLKVSLRLLDDAGRRVAQSDHFLVRTGLFEPTSAWAGNERERTFHLLPLPRELLAGTYRVAVVVYEAETSRPLPVEGGPEIIVGTLSVTR